MGNGLRREYGVSSILDSIIAVDADDDGGCGGAMVVAVEVIVMG